MHLAAKRPDLFSAAGSMSGNVGGRSFGGLGTPVVDGGPAFQEAGTYYYGSLPAELASNLDGVDLVINWGASCGSDLAEDLCATWGFEQAFRLDNQHLRDRLEAVGHRGGLAYSEDEGGHSWRWWPAWLRELHLPVILPRLADPMPASRRLPPAAVPAFRFRSIAASFEVYGWRVEMDRPAREFLDLEEVSARGLTIQGSGTAVVRTPALYRPRRAYRISVGGSGDHVVRADRAGRLRFAVDLGPGHTAEQHSPQGRAAQSAGDYFTRRTISIRAAPGR